MVRGRRGSHSLSQQISRQGHFQLEGEFQTDLLPAREFCASRPGPTFRALKETTAKRMGLTSRRVKASS